jgi:hypothetical protein
LTKEDFVLAQSKSSEASHVRNCLAGDKQPKFIGQSVRECFPETWRIIGPYIEEALRWLADVSEAAGRESGGAVFANQR